jgi:signal transduction histidine kinase
MEAVGRLARGVAHDFNNVLATVQGSVYMLKKRLEDEGQEMHYAEQISTSLAKLKSLIHGLLTFSQTQTVRFGTVDVNKVIRKLTVVLDGLAGNTMEVRTILSQERLVVKGDALQIERVLMNLCTNARDAMPEGGIFMVQTALVHAGEAPRVSSLTKGGSYVLISAADKGCGIDPETKGKMFDPFFSTKPRGKGSGLGLSIVFGIIEQHGGQIEVQTEIGKGTEFRIYLPLWEETEKTHV